MAALTDTEKRQLRRQMENKANSLGAAVRWDKAGIHAVMQAIEDRILTDTIGTGNNTKTPATIISEAVDAAATIHGLTFTVAEKKFIFAFWAKAKFERDK